MRHSTLVVVLLLLAGPAWPADAVHPALLRYQQKVAEDDFAGALLELNRGLRGHPSLQEQVELRIAKVDFYHRYARDFDRALKELREARTKLSELGPETRRSIDERIEAIRSEAAKYWRSNAYVDDFSRRLSADERVARIDETRQRLQSSDEQNPFRGALAHCLGVGYSEAKQYHDAYNAFSLALQIAPALDFAYPTTSFREVALSRWKDEALRNGVTVAMSVLLGLIVLGFFASRPQRWLRWRHLLPLPVVTFAWLLVHRGLILLSAAWANASLPEGEMGIVVNSHPGAPLSEPLTEHLFGYGLAGIVPLFLASLAISRIRLPLTRYVASAAVAVCVMGSVMVAFGLKQDRATIVRREDSRFEYLLGSCWYRTDDPLPYTLTDPQAYPDQSLENLDEERVMAYLREMQYVEGGKVGADE